MDAAARFWLPTDFLTEDGNYSVVDPLTASGSRHRAGLSLPVSVSSAVSALGSPVSSTDTEPDQEELIAELTRQLARSSLLDADSTARKLIPSSQAFSREATKKPWMKMATSPQSTLTSFPAWVNRSGNVTPNGDTSQLPDELELLYEAARQVAMVKMSAAARAQMNLQRNRGLMDSHRNLESNDASSTMCCGLESHPQDFFSFTFPHTNQYHVASQVVKQQQWLNRVRYCEGCCGGCARGRPPPSWPSLRCAQPQPHSQLLCKGVEHQHTIGGGGVGGGAASRPVLIKSQSVGTGVFLPRRYGAVPAEPRQKTERVVQEANVNLEGANSHHNHHQTLVPDDDVRRNAAAALGWREQQQRRSVVMAAEVGSMNREILLLPHEWTY